VTGPRSSTKTNRTDRTVTRARSAVTQQIVEAPETLTVEQIRNEPNQEIRRIMVERFTPERFLQESDARKIDSDDWGILWEIPDAPDDPDRPLRMVEVVNSTPEPDGSSKRYWLRVPPGTETPAEGVAWTFEMPVKEYKRMVAQS
jgi:hypothetical protein